MKKGLLSILSAVVIFSLTACSGNSGNESAPGTLIQGSDNSNGSSIQESSSPQNSLSTNLANSENTSLPDQVQTSGCEVLGRIDNGNEASLTVTLRDDSIYDFWFSDGTEESLILSSPVLIGGFCKSNIGGKDFLIVYEHVIGHAYPADIVTIIDEKPEIISALNYETEYSGLFYSPSGDIVCMRGEGVSIGSHNVIPYYWNEETVNFVPYAVKEIGLDELKALDTQNVVENPNNITSVYRRDNGLVHVNYNVSDNAVENATASETYVYSDVGTETGLRKYDFDNDAAYGFFLECLQITE